MQAERIAAIAPAQTGVHGTSSALAKLLYLLDGGLSGEVRHAVHQADWIAGRLAGRHGVSDENNALKLGYDPVTRTRPAGSISLAFRATCFQTSWSQESRSPTSIQSLQKS